MSGKITKISTIFLNLALLKAKKYEIASPIEISSKKLQNRALALSIRGCAIQAMSLI